jgi:membrane protein YdbS with pleckstrin-like domain
MTDTQSTSDTVLETHPTIKPTVLQMILLVIVGAGIVLFLQANPRLLGESQITEVAILVVVLLVGIGLVRLLIRAIVYTRTRYQVMDDRVRKTYELLYRRKDKEVPYGLVRSHEFSQGRIEKAMGYGTAKLNQGLGTITFRHIEHPHEFHEAVSRKLQQGN